jgi:hypothetical protein
MHERRRMVGGGLEKGGVFWMPINKDLGIT